MFLILVYIACLIFFLFLLGLLAAISDPRTELFDFEILSSSLVCIGILSLLGGFGAILIVPTLCIIAIFLISYIPIFRVAKVAMEVMLSACLHIVSRVRQSILFLSRVAKVVMEVMLSACLQIVSRIRQSIPLLSGPRALTTQPPALTTHLYWSEVSLDSRIEHRSSTVEPAPEDWNPFREGIGLGTPGRGLEAAFSGMGQTGSSSEPIALTSDFVSSDLSVEQQTSNPTRNLPLAPVRRCSCKHGRGLRPVCRETGHNRLTCPKKKARKVEKPMHRLKLLAKDIPGHTRPRMRVKSSRRLRWL